MHFAACLAPLGRTRQLEYANALRLGGDCLHRSKGCVDCMRSLHPSGLLDWSVPACSLIMYSELDTFPDHISGSCISFIQQVGLADFGPARHEHSMHPGISQWELPALVSPSLCRIGLGGACHACSTTTNGLPGTGQHCLGCLGMRWRAHCACSCMLALSSVKPSCSGVVPTAQHHPCLHAGPDQVANRAA